MFLGWAFSVVGRLGQLNLNKKMVVGKYWGQCLPTINSTVIGRIIGGAKNEFEIHSFWLVQLKITLAFYLYATGRMLEQRLKILARDWLVSSWVWGHWVSECNRCRPVFFDETRDSWIVYRDWFAMFGSDLQRRHKEVWVELVGKENWSCFVVKFW